MSKISKAEAARLNGQKGGRPRKTVENNRPRTGFKPGQSGNPNGRPRGTQNRATSEIRAAAQRLLSDPEYTNELRRRLIAGKAPHMETLLHHYGYGKPLESIALSGEDGGPVVVRFVEA